MATSSPETRVRLQDRTVSPTRKRNGYSVDTFARYGIPKPGEDDKGDEDVERKRREIERALLRSFMRKAHHYMPHEPHPDDLLEWLAMMRHYGAPARMLDWTYSFYVGVYNAVENWATENDVIQEGKWPVIWALDAGDLKRDRWLSRLERMVPEAVDETRRQQNSVLKDLMETPTPRPLVYNTTGFRLNERLTAQQGTFLVQGTLAKSFSENLEASLGTDPKNPLYRICLKIDEAGRDEILCELNNMNINHATLYPDLEGFAKSLERHLAYPENWGLAVKKEY
jgi:ribulose bisphosphate carboxylase small subunit